VPVSDTGTDGGMTSVFHAIKSQDWTTARARCEFILSRDPQSADALHALSITCSSQGHQEAAIAHLLDALKIRPHPTWYNNLGVLYSLTHQWKNAADAFRHALELQPEDEDALYHLGLVSCHAGDPALSIEILSRMASARPRDAQVWSDLGHALLLGTEAARAYAALQRAIELDPEVVPARQYLVQVCLTLHRFPEAVIHAKRLVELHPGADSYIYLAIALSETGDLDSALAARDQAYNFGIKDPKLHSSLLRLSQFDPAESGSSLLRSHRQWAITHCTVWPVERTYRNSRSPNRKLRIGFVTAELLTTPARHFYLPLLSSLNRELFDVYVYNVSPPSADGDCLPGLTRELRSTSDEEAAELIRGDQIDILVDCSGHQSYGRPRIFALRPAPVQVAYSAYPGTTGLTVMDRLFTDAVLSPAGSEVEYSEPLHRFEGGCIVYSPPVNAPAVCELPAFSNDHITFGVFQARAKLNQDFLRLIAEVLHAVPQSRLLIHHADPAYDERSSSAIERIAGAMSKQGIESHRIDFVGGRALSDHLAVISRADIALDSLPFNGHTTTCESLWMGVPVVTQCGRSHAGRVSASLLTQIDCQEWITLSRSGYVAVATTLASDINTLAAIRAQLRNRITMSSLTDLSGRAAEFERACCELWEEWRIRSAEEL